MAAESVGRGDVVESAALRVSEPSRAFLPRLVARLEEVAALAERYREARGDEESVDEAHEAA